MNLDFIDVLKSFGVEVGLSDHSGSLAAGIAVSKGADLVRETLTFDRGAEALTMLMQWNLTCSPSM